MANKFEINRLVREKSGLSWRETAEAIDSFFEFIKDALREGERVEIRGFGTFELRVIPAKECVTLKGGRKIIPAHARVVFKPCEKLRMSVWNVEIKNTPQGA
jgi:nucleoid DNA-binding protein